MSSSFPSCLEIYVEMEYTNSQEQMALLCSSFFIGMMTQENIPTSEPPSMLFPDYSSLNQVRLMSQQSIPTSEQPSMPFPNYSSHNQVRSPNYSHHIGGYSMPTLCHDVPGPNTEGHNNEGSNEGPNTEYQQFIRMEDFVGFSGYDDDVDICSLGGESNSNEDVDALMMSEQDYDIDEEDNDEEDIDVEDVDDYSGGPLTILTYNGVTPMPYYFNINLGNGGSTCSRDIVNRGPLWNASTKKLERGMIFKDKIQLKHVVIAYHVKQNL